jgi:hypothetical protein
LAWNRFAAVVALLRHHEPAEAGVLLAVLAAAAIAARTLVSELRAAPVEPGLLA